MILRCVTVAAVQRAVDRVARPAFAVGVWAIGAIALTFVQMSTGARWGGLAIDRARWDAGTQLEIARTGYTADSAYHFPGLVIATRFVHTLGLDWPMAALWVSLLSGAGAAVAFAAWCADRGLHPVAVRIGTIGLVAFPYGFFLLGIPYNDGLFLLLAISAWLAVDRDRPWLATLLSMAACATRLVGVVLVAALILRSIERRRPGGLRRISDARAVRPIDVAPLLGLLGLVAFMTYCAVRFHDPLIYFRIQNTLAVRARPLHPGTWPPLMLLRRFGIDWRTDRASLLSVAIQGPVFLAVTCSVPALWRRYGTAATAYVVGMLAVVWFGPYKFASAGRYLMAAFPAFAVLGEAVARRGWAVRVTFGGVSAACSLVLAWGFLTGHIAIPW